MELVERDGLLGEFECAGCLAAFEAGVAGTLKQSEQSGVQPVDVRVGP